MKISIVGGGDVGTAWAWLLKDEHEITIIDTNEDKIVEIHENINSGYYGNKLVKIVSASNFSYKDEDVVFVSVPTDFDSNLQKMDCGIVENVIEQIISQNDECLIIIKSTLSIGFSAYLCKKYKLQERLAYSPEFLREGIALYDVCNPERVVIGCESSAVSNKIIKILKNIYGLFDNYQTVAFVEAEAIKLFSNAYLAMRVDFFNIVDTFSMHMGVDANNLIKGICSDERIGNVYNNPSFGYGGYCLPKDTAQLAIDLTRLNIKSSLIDAITNNNLQRIEYLAAKIIESTKEGDCIGIYRLNVKTKSDNLRDSSTLKLLGYIQNERKNIVVYEPLLSSQKECKTGLEVIDELCLFKKKADVIIANRYDMELDDVKGKVFTRDLYSEN